MSPPQLPARPTTHFIVYMTVGSSMLPPSFAQGCRMMTPRLGAAAQLKTRRGGGSWGVSGWVGVLCTCVVCVVHMLLLTWRGPDIQLQCACGSVQGVGRAPERCGGGHSRWLSCVFFCVCVCEGGGEPPARPSSLLLGMMIAEGVASKETQVNKFLTVEKSDDAEV